MAIDVPDTLGYVVEFPAPFAPLTQASQYWSVIENEIDKANRNAWLGGSGLWRGLHVRIYSACKHAAGFSPSNNAHLYRYSIGLIGGQFDVNSCKGGPTKIFTDQDWQDGRPVLNDTFDDSDIKGADLGTSFDGTLNGQRALFFFPGDINNLNADTSMAVSHSGSPDHFQLRFLKETRGPNKGSTFLFGKGNHVPFNMGRVLSQKLYLPREDTLKRR